MKADTIIGICWIIFIAYWVFSAIHTKKDVYRDASPVRYIVIVFVLISVLLSNVPFFTLPFLPQTVALQSVAVVLCIVGIAIAIWARVYLGTNWSSRPALKEGHELVTTGPYRYVRHPIYTGILLAMVGSILIGGLIWFLFFIAFAVMIGMRVPAEDKLMEKQFPAAYPEYKKKTKALIPFVF